MFMRNEKEKNIVFYSLAFNVGYSWFWNLVVCYGVLWHVRFLLPSSCVVPMQTILNDSHFQCLPSPFSLSWEMPFSALFEISPGIYSYAMMHQTWYLNIGKTACLRCGHDEITLNCGAVAGRTKHWNCPLKLTCLAWHKNGLLLKISLACLHVPSRTIIS